MFKILSIKRQLNSDMTDFYLSNLKYRMTARPIILWMYIYSGWIRNSEHKIKGFQTPWITLVWSKL